MKFFTLFFLFFSTNGFSQLNDIELESIDDLEILEAFEETSDEIVEFEDDPPPQSEEEKFTDEDIHLEEKDLLTNITKTKEDDSDTSSPLENDLSQPPQELKESITELNIDRNLTPKYENLIKKDEISLDEELQYSETSEDNIEEHAKIIKNFKIDNTPTSIDRIIYEKEKNTNSRFKDWEKAALKIQLEDISRSQLRLGQIYKGTLLVDIITNKTHYTQKTLNVRFHEKADSSKHRYLRSKDGSLKFKTFHKNIANINRVSSLYRAPHKFKRLKLNKKKVVFDKKLSGIYKFNFHSGLNNPNYTDDLLDDPSGIAPLVRLEFSYLTSQSNYFETGITAMYESLSGKLNSGGSYSFSSYSIGLNVVSPKVLGHYNFLLQPRVSLASNLSISRTDETHSLDMVETSLLLGLERRIEFEPYGTYNLGFNYQRKWYQADSKNVILDTNSEYAYDDSIALSFGFRIE